MGSLSSVTDLDDTAAAVLTASRALLAVVARSVAPALEQVTVPQFRVLVVLSTSGAPVRHRDLADALGVHSSTFTRTTDRLVSSGWVTRAENPDNRRETLVSLTAQGRDLVAEVTESRRDEIRSILRRLPAARRADVLAALRDFADAAGEPSVPALAEFTV